ncbi:hypothetical protein GLYMA_14G052034v4 [Glycine max]|nr:hypothetical protein GLYMA_14G052034v4 [Glycine max]KAH1093171.1 hypothetical protein GYH30_039076 [Glycine max]
MGSKTKIALLIIPLAMFLFICSEVTARDFQEAERYIFCLILSKGCSRGQ